MLPSQSAEMLKQFLGARGLDIEFAPMDQIVDAVLDFYATVPASGLSSDPDADMLLFQYGVYDWGRGEYFEFDLTRQFILAGEVDDEPISQLRCTTMYEPVAELRVLQASNFWCASRNELDAFRKNILSSPSYQAALSAMPIERAIRWEQA